MTGFENNQSQQNELLSSQSITQESNNTPEDILSQIDSDSEFHETAQQNYGDLLEKNHAEKQQEVQQTSQKIDSMKLEVEKQIFQEQLGEYSSVLPVDKIYDICVENTQLKEQLLLVLKYGDKNTILSYVERRMKRPSRIKERTLVRMIEKFEDVTLQHISKLITQGEVINTTKEMITDNAIKNENEKSKNYEASIISLQEAYDGITVEKFPDAKYSDIIQAIDSFKDDGNIDNLKLVLLDNPENQKLFKELLIDLAETDTETYQRVYTALKEVPAFENFLQNLPTPTHPEAFIPKPDGPDNKSTDLLIAESLVGEDIEKTGDKIYDEDRVIDLAEFPPKYYIVTENGFRLETTVEFGPEITDARTEYMEQKTLLQTEYDEVDNKYDFAKQKLDTLNSNLKYAESLEGEDTTEIKEQIKNIELELKNLIDQKDNIKDRFQALEDHFKPYLSHLLEQYKTKLEEKETKAREAKEFISRIGLDLLPQSTINQIFSEMKIGSLVVNGMGSFDPKKIDLANGNFGESGHESDGTKWQENMVKLFNKMISGNTGEPLELTQFIGEMSGRVDPTYFKEDLETAGIINDLGEPQLTKMRSNLRIENNTEK